MKKKIVGSNFASLFFIGYLFSLPAFSIFAFLLCLCWICSRYEITIIGNGRFVCFPAKPEFIITYV